MDIRPHQKGEKKKKAHSSSSSFTSDIRALELCERGGCRPRLPSLTVYTVPVDVNPAAWKDYSSEVNSCALENVDVLVSPSLTVRTVPVDVNPAVVLVVVEVLLSVHRNRRLIRDGSPRRPPRFSPSS